MLLLILQIRKLELMLAEAVDKGCDCVITFGSSQSNHARATTVAARQLGLDSHLIFLSNKVCNSYPLCYCSHRGAVCN